ncbi:voltage-dependent chloride channel 1, chloroplastic-like [Bidens hawaiensis]|uniref:voltage-dependent chloride channel 1, chloroplastic-like n=1 Tax=Bidens hawaiensis TaxID=980011 RepID=UPI00404AE313
MTTIKPPNPIQTLTLPSSSSSSSSSQFSKFTPKILSSHHQPPPKPITLLSVLRSIPDWADGIKERRMKQRRPLYSHHDWIRHRSSLRHLRHLLSSLTSRVILSLVPPVIAFTSVAAVVASYNTAVIWHLLPEVFPVLRASSLPYQLTAPALALLLVFRTEASYSRFEEGRKAWSKVIYGTNDFARQVMVTVEAEEDFVVKNALLRYIMAFPVALKCHLVYESDIGTDLNGLLEDDDLAILLSSNHHPRCIIQFISQSVKLLDLEEPKRTVLESKVTCFHEGIGVCEQIMGIPIPLSYTRLTSRFLVLWHLTLPIILWDDCNWIVVPATFVSAASLFCIEEVGVLIEEPFQMLSLDELCVRVCENVEEAIKSEKKIQETLIMRKEAATYPSLNGHPTSGDEQMSRSNSNSPSSR